MKNSISKISKLLLVITASAAITSCGSLGGFSEMLGIDNKGIDANTVETNPTLKSASGSTLPTPEGAAAANVSATTPSVSAPKIIAPKIVAPKIVAPKITKPRVSKPKVSVAKVTRPKITTPKVVVPKVTTPKVTTPKVTTPKVVVKPVQVAKVTPPAKIAPTAYKFVSLFAFRSDMRAGKLQSPLATAKHVATTSPNLCKLEGTKFTCGEYFITVK